MSYMKAVQEFHDKFGLPVLDKPQIPSQDRIELRLKLIHEELEELEVAVAAGDVVGAADGMADLTYVICGMALEFGIPLDPIFTEVHRSNMTKVWDDGTIHRRKDGKILKPPTYSPADIKGIIGGL